MSRYPLLPFTIPFILGIAVCFLTGLTGWFIIVPAVAAAAAYLSRHRLIALVLLGFVTGYLVAVLRAPGEMPSGLSGEHLYSGIITAEKEQSSMKVMIVKIDSCDSKPVTHFLVKGILPSLGLGGEERDRITFKGTLSPLSHDTDLPDETDYNAPLARQGVKGECYVVPDSVRSIAPEPGVLNDLRRFRIDVASVLSQGSLSSDATDFLIATLTGERDILTHSHRDLFSRVGLAHLLALSGLHVGIIALVISFILFPFILMGLRHWAGIVTVIAMWGFAILTGLTPSVTRSVIMCSVFVITAMLQREWTPVNALCIAAIVILFFSPVSLFSLGFQLSFVAVLSIIIFASPLNPLNRPGTPGRWLLMLLTIPIAAMLGTGMISAFHFHSFPLLFLVSNAVSSLTLPMLLGSGVVKILAGFLGLPTVILDKTIEFLYGIIDGVARMVDSLPLSSQNGIFVSATLVAVWFIVLLFFALWLYRRRRVWLAATAMTLILCISLPYLLERSYPQEELYVTRSHSETTIMVRDGDRFLTLTTAHPSQASVKMSRDSVRYSVYMMKRGLEGISLLPDGYRSDAVIRQGNIVIFRSWRLQLVTSDFNRHTDRLDYAVICRGFRGDIVEISQYLGADTVLLSSDLDLRRHYRYLRELSAAAIPHRSLREAPLVLR